MRAEIWRDEEICVDFCSKAPMIVRDFCFNSVEDFFSSCGGETDIALIQLSRGHLDFHSSQVDLGGVRIEWNQVGARIRSREVYRGPGIMLGWVLQSPAEVKSCGSKAHFGEVVVWPIGNEFEYLAPSGLTSLVILVDQDLIDLLGWQIHGGLWRRVPEPQLRHLQRVCREATAVARRWDLGIGSEPRTILGGGEGAGWRDHILAALEPVLAPWLMGPGDQHGSSGDCREYRIVREIEQLFGDGATDLNLDAEALAETLGVSRRTLFHAFRQWMGIGPLAYLKLVRLHQLRARLLAASADTSSVMRLAMDLGFTHMGRLSADYREHFGEYPSETLRRR